MDLNTDLEHPFGLLSILKLYRLNHVSEGQTRLCQSQHEKRSIVIMQRTLPTEMQNTSNAVLDSLVQTKSTTGCEKGIDIVKKKQSWWNRKLWHGWRKGVTISVICNIVALVFNSSLLLWAIYQRNPSPDGWILWQGSHDTLNLIDTLSHLAINIVSTAILAGSNYTLQILLAPTRKNIDRAHRKKQ